MDGIYLQYGVRSTLEDFDRAAFEWQLNTYSRYRGYYNEH
jgi:hypothetical protein